MTNMSKINLLSAAILLTCVSCGGDFGIAPEQPLAKNQKIAFITAIYGGYEATCKPFAKQTVPTDFICFTDSENVASNGWDVDRIPYHTQNPSAIDNGTYLNSLKNNQHTFNLAKYYKQAFQNIPRLKGYDVVVWLDGTVEIKNSKTAEWILQKIKDYPIITWEHPWRAGFLKDEADASMGMDRYASTFMFGQKQPFQNVTAQYEAYLKNGYREDFWKEVMPARKHFGVWWTSFVAFNNRNLEVGKFLDFWYLQTLQYSTQDQVGFPYAIQKLKFYPYTLPDQEINGRPEDENDFYIRHNHGK